MSARFFCLLIESSKGHHRRFFLHLGRIMGSKNGQTNSNQLKFIEDANEIFFLCIFNVVQIRRVFRLIAMQNGKQLIKNQFYILLLLIDDRASLYSYVICVINLNCFLFTLLSPATLECDYLFIIFVNHALNFLYCALVRHSHHIFFCLLLLFTLDCMCISASLSVVSKPNYYHLQ